MLPGERNGASLNIVAKENYFAFIRAYLARFVNNPTLLHKHDYKTSSDLFIAASRALVDAIKNADLKSLALLIQEWAKPAATSEHRGKNTFYWLASAINEAVFAKRKNAHLVTLTEPFIALLEKADATLFVDLMHACVKSAEVGDKKGKNALYWLVVTICKCMQTETSHEKLATLTRPLLILLKKIDSVLLSNLVETSAIPADLWLVKTIKVAIEHKISPEQLETICQPLLILLEKISSQKQLDQLLIKLNNPQEMRVVRDHFKFYLLQDRPHENPRACLKRLESYLNPNNPVYSFIATHMPSFIVYGETDTVTKIRKKINAQRLSLKSSMIWQDEFANFAEIDLFLKQKPAQVLARLNTKDTANQTLRDYLLSEETTKPFILYRLLKLGDEGVQQLNGMQATLWNWIVNLSLPPARKDQLLNEARSASSALYRFLAKDEKVLTEMNILAPSDPPPAYNAPKKTCSSIYTSGLTLVENLADTPRPPTTLPGTNAVSEPGRTHATTPNIVATALRVKCPG